MKTLAAIDAGSNSALLLIAKVSTSGSISPLYSGRETPRLAAGISETGKISEHSLRRFVAAIRQFKGICDDYSVDDIRCYGTSALRRASNESDVKWAIRHETGIILQTISGEREAALTYMGATTGMPGLKPMRVAVDAGGGSTEIVLGDDSQINYTRSIDVGAVGLTQEFRTHRKLSRPGIVRIEEAIAGRVRRLRKPRIASDFSLILSGGTPTTIQAFRAGLTDYRPEFIHGASMRVEEYRLLVYRLATMSQRDRQAVMEYDPGRADVIVAGGLLTLAIVEHLGANSVRISDRGLRHGMLLEMVGREPEFS